MGRAADRQSQREEIDFLRQQNTEFELLLDIQKAQLDSLMVERQHFKSLEKVCESLRPPIRQISAILRNLADIRFKLKRKGIKLT